MPVEVTTSGSVTTLPKITVPVELYRYRAVSGGSGHAPNAPLSPGDTQLSAAGSQAAMGHELVRIELPDEGKTTGDIIADTALASARAVNRYLADAFGRDGWDGKGSALRVAVHAPEANNAYWVSKELRVDLGDGDGTLFGPLGSSRSVVAHEVVHGIVASEVRLDYHKPQQGALNESFADVLATGIGGDGWRIGADAWTPKVAGDEIRDLSKPLLSSMAQARGSRIEVHALSGIPSLAAVRVADTLGADAMRSLWYRALTKYLHSGAGFTEAARATLNAATELYGPASSQTQAVRQAWESVGVAPTWTPSRTALRQYAQTRGETRDETASNDRWRAEHGAME